MVDEVLRKTSVAAQLDELISLPTGPIIEVSVESIAEFVDVRIRGVELEHAHNLAQLEVELPPILLDGAERRVIDGRHRVKAAQINGHHTIRAIIFDGSPEEAFILAVQANIAHGLPLSLADRRAAAERIARSRPELSDRSIARTAGLSAKTVSSIRRSTADGPQSNARVGQDGRVRPLDAAVGRQAAVELITAQPEASLRTIAKEAGISISTARDVRERLRAGESPVLAGRPGRDDLDTRRRANDAGASRAGGDRRIADARSILDTLRHDPVLRYNESGRQFLRWLASRALGPEEWRSFLDHVSPHSAVLVGRLARECSASWAQLAEEFEGKSKNSA